MKIIISFLATAFLAAMTLGQEESASPPESTTPTTEEKASATIEETPAPKPVEATAPVAEKKAEPATSPTALNKEATTTTATKPAAPTAAAAPSGKKMSVKEMEEKWEASIPSHDFSTVQGFVSSDFVGISSQGKFVDKSSMLAEFKKDKDTCKTSILRAKLTDDCAARFVRQRLIPCRGAQENQWPIRFGTKTRSSTSCMSKPFMTAMVTASAIFAA